MAEQDNPLSEREKDRIQLFRSALATAERYVFLTNSGGVIATMTFIGTSWGKDHAPGKWALIPPCLFLLGLAACGMGLNSRLLLIVDTAYREGLKKAGPLAILPKIPKA